MNPVMSRTLHVCRRLFRLGAGRIPGVGASGRRLFTVSAAVSAPGSLPLEGYRVLDMTRVLAGVRSPHNHSRILRALN
jgi:succinate--hydroxymethylglutarate CoA-transferase